MDKTVRGIGFGALAGVLWGLVFLAPQILHGFSPVQIAFGRFFFFGLASLTAAAPVWRLFKSLSVRDRIHTFLLSAAGFWLFTVLLFYGVQLSGGVIAALMMGFYCITIPLASQPLKSFRASFLSGLGILVLGVIVLQSPQIFGGNIDVSFPGLACLAAAVLLWTWFALKNTEFLQKHPDLSRAHLVSLMGIFSALALFCAMPFAGGLPDFGENGAKFIVWTAIIGLGGTWAANWFWNKCCSLCPPAITGPLVVTETIFGLLYTFIYQQRYPETHEIVAILLFFYGMMLAIRAETKDRKKKD